MICECLRIGKILNLLGELTAFIPSLKEGVFPPFEIKSAKWGLAKDYEHYLQTSEDGDGRFKFTEYGLKMKKKFLALVDTTIPISEVT